MFLQPRVHSWCSLNEHQNQQHHNHHHHQQQQQQLCATRRQRGVAAAAAARRQQRRQQQQLLLIACRAGTQHSSSSSSSEVLVERTHDHNWRSPLAGHDAADPRCRPVLALGKFDALHKGHQALAAAALQLGGSPVLLSFSGMGAVLGWAPRKPLVAPCDRPRVLHLWAQQLADQQQQQQQPAAAAAARQRPRAARARHATASTSGHIEVDAAPQSPSSYGDSGGDHQQQQPLLVPVRQRYMPFAAVRSLSPQAFVDIIGSDFKAAGVVAGENYRFGYKAAGDTALLQALSGAAGLRCAVVPLVGAGEPGAVGTVSSSRIRQMLDSCRIEAVRRSLGRPYRLVAELPLPDGQQQQRDGKVFVPLSSCLNQHPAPGVYRCSLRLYVGADRDGDLLQLQQEFPDSSSSSSLAGGDGGGSSGVQVLSRVASSPAGGRRNGHVACSSRWCVAAAGAEVEVAPDGLLLPRELFDAAEACLNNAAALSSSSSSSSLSGSDGGSTVAVRPTAWDTDDRDDDDEEEDGDQDDEAAISTCLLALDFESCLMQLCALR